METKIGGENHRFYGPGGSELKGVGKKSLEWDLNDWKWDGDLFIASPLNSMPSDCRSRQFFPVGSGMQANGGSSNSSSSYSDEITPRSEKGDRELEKRRRAVVIEDDDFNDEARSLTLKLGGHDYPIMEGGEVGNWDRKTGKKTKLLGGTSNHAVCQVEDCGADLSNAKDYHKRHKVCEIHSKASKALVGNIMQRFCQQCSRFHVLQEFDEGKRSCRRRLAGHNRRRRKTHPDAVANGSSLNDEQASSYLLISLLRILTNMHANSSDQTKDQDLLTHLLRNLATLANTYDGRNISGLLQESQDRLSARPSVATSEMVPILHSNAPDPSGPFCSTSKINGITGAKCPPMKSIEKYVTVTASEIPQKGMVTDDSRGALQIASSSKSTFIFPMKDRYAAKGEASEATEGRGKLSNIDLNNIYDDSQDCIEYPDISAVPANQGTGSHDRPSWVQQDFHQLSPPQTSRNSDSASAQSPSSSSGDAQSRTDRIVFKLFGKNPTDFPLVLRAQILDWLSRSPTDIESYIRPGCIILTIYLRLAESTWEELRCDLTSSLSRLLDVSDNTFWRTGWVYTRVQHRIAFMYNGQVVLDTSLPAKSHNNCRIASVRPIAISVSERAQIVVRGYNLTQPSTRLLCALEGKYLVQKTTHDLVEDVVTSKEHDEFQCLSFPCAIPNVIGRGFIEVEEHGLSGGFFPFIVAEHDVCSEIRMLESVVEVVETGDQVPEETKRMEAKNQALDFIHEMGWLLHRSHLQSRLGHADLNSNIFCFKRFRWLMEFSMDRDWCAVVKKLLDILLEGTVHVEEYASIELALSDLGLLHRAVRRNSTVLVEFLLRYSPNKALNKPGSEFKKQISGGHERFLFKPDVVGPAGLTPLHIAAGIDDSESMLDALTDDPGLVGIEAWKNARDNTGFTPEDYARLRGHYSYIHLVQKKANKKSESGQVVLDIPGVVVDWNADHKQVDGRHSAKATGFQIERTEPRLIQQNCKLCNQKLAYGTGRSLAYRPAILSMVAIAAVCVCVALLFKSSPEVLCVFPPFRWELLDYGAI